MYFLEKGSSLEQLQVAKSFLLPLTLFKVLLLISSQVWIRQSNIYLNSNTHLSCILTQFGKHDWISVRQRHNPVNCYMLDPYLKVKHHSTSITHLSVKNFWHLVILPKAQRTWGLGSAFQSPNKFKHKFWSNFIFRISTKHQLQNLDQTSASRQNLEFKILTKASFTISTNSWLNNLYKTSAAKYWPNKSSLNFNFKILTKL